MKRLVTAVLSLFLFISLFGGISMGATELTAADLTDAYGNYAGPLTDSEGRTQSEAIADYYDNLYIGDWVPCLNTEEDVKNMADCGVRFTFIWGFSYSDAEKVRQLLWCMKYNIKVFLMDSSVTLVSGALKTDRTAEEIEEAIKPSLGNPYILGYDIYDEPKANYTELQDYVKRYYSVSRGMIGFVNFLPLVSSVDNTYYDEAFEAYGLDYVSFDIYPLPDTGSKTIQDNFFYNTSLAATSARKHNGYAWQFIQTMSYTAHRVPSYEDMTFQAYTCLANGVTKLLGFCYCRPNNSPGGEFADSVAAVECDGTKTYLYDTVKKFNTEIGFLSKYISAYKNTGVYTAEGTEGATPVYAGESNIFGRIIPNGGIRGLSSTQPLLIGEYEAKQGASTGYIILNCSDMNNDATAFITFKSPYTDRIIVVNKGKAETVYADKNGDFKLSLSSGDGAFIIIKHGDSSEYIQNVSDINDINALVRPFTEACENGSSESYTATSCDAVKTAYKELSDAVLYGTEDITDDIKRLRSSIDGLAYKFDIVAKTATEYIKIAEEIIPSLFDKTTLNAFLDKAKTVTALIEEHDVTKYSALRRQINSMKTSLEKLKFIGKKGDCNGDGEIKLADAMSIFRVVAKVSESNINIDNAGDTDGNGIITLADAMTVFKTVARVK